MIGLVPFAVSGDNPCIYHRYELSENRLSKKISTFVHCRLYIVVNTKLQLLVRRAKLKFARVLFLKSFYRTTVIKNTRNGENNNEKKMVTVVSDDAVEAEVLSTTLMIAEHEELD